MKNIEKYTNTKVALKAYNNLKTKGVPFDEWLKCEYEEQRNPSLMDAAQAVTTAWFSIGDKGSLAEVSKRICDLSYAIEREKRKPVRNCDKYKTADEASKAFSFMCDNTECEHCPYNQGEAFKCKFAWLYAKAEKEEK